MGRYPLRVPCLLCTLCVLVPGALLLLLFVSIAGSGFAAQPVGPQAGAGGAPVPRGTFLPPLLALTPTTAALGVLYGGRGPDGSCSNPPGGGSIASMVQQDFHWESARLDPRYQHDSVDRLCNDFWAWFDPAGQNVPVRQVLQTLHWPDNLFARPWLSGQVHVSWLPIAFPTTPNPVCPGGQNCGVPNENPACYWSPQVGPFQPTFNLCAPVRAAINAVANAMGQGYRDNIARLPFLWRTPLAPFQDDATSGLLSLWSLSWHLVLFAIASVIAWGALRSMIGAVVNWLSYAQIIELLPRLLFALLAALLSRQVFILLIQSSNALSTVFSSSIFQTIIMHPNPGIRLGLLQILYGLLGLALVVEGAARLALIEALFAASPLLFFLAALPETQRWAQTSAVAAVLLIFMQAVQAFLLDVGDHLLMSILHTHGGAPDGVQLLVALAVLYLTLTLFVALLRAAFGPGGYALGGFPLLALALLRRASRGARSGLHAVGGRAGATPGGMTSTGGRFAFTGVQAGTGRGQSLRTGRGSAFSPGGSSPSGQRRARQQSPQGTAQGRQGVVSAGSSRRSGAPSPAPAIPRTPLTRPLRPAAPARSFVRPFVPPAPTSGEGPTVSPQVQANKEEEE